MYHNTSRFKIQHEFITSPILQNGGGYVFIRVCLSVCISVCLELFLDHSKVKATGAKLEGTSTPKSASLHHKNAFFSYSISIKYLKGKVLR